MQIRALQPVAVQVEGLRSGKLEPAPGVLPRSDDRGKQGHRAHRHGATLAALDSVIQADDGRPRSGVLARQRGDLFGFQAGQLGRAPRGPVPHPLAQRFEALGVARHVVRIVEVLSHDDVHHGQSQRRVAAGIDGEMLIRRGGGAVAPRVDDVELGPLAARLHDKGPQVYVRPENVGAPG